MNPIEYIEQLQILSTEIRAKRKGFLTNFYLDEVKHGLWIRKSVFHYEWIGDTLFFMKKSDAFWNVFYCTTTLTEFAEDLKKFTSRYSEITMMFDIVGREIQCAPVVELFQTQGYSVATSLMRMTRISEPMEYKEDTAVRKASLNDIPAINKLLHQFFDEKTEQIPYIEELKNYAQQGHVLTCMEDNRMEGFLIYEKNASTQYLRYWFTHPDFRDKKVGSRLLRRFFEEGKDTKRHLFWVIRSNENAIKRYRHYGFSEENMFDYVMQYN